MHQLTFRAATSNDKDQVAAISSQIWEGEDYVADSFDQWLADPNGRFTVALLDNQLAGFNKITQHAPEEWWLEGLRVDPRFRSLRIASQLHHEAIRWLDQHGSGVVRFSSENERVHTLALKTGFHLSSTHLITHQNQKSKLTTHQFQLALPEELPQLEEKLADQFMERDWIWKRINTHLPTLLAKKSVVWWKEKEGVLILRPRQKELISLSYIQSNKENYPIILEQLPLFLMDHYFHTNIEAKISIDEIDETVWQMADWIIDREIAHLYVRHLK